MQTLLRNIVGIQVALVACVIAWLFGGTYGGYMETVIPWMLVILFELMLCFPQNHSVETTYQARERVWKRLRKDPLMWVTLAFTVLMLVPFLNTGLCENCDAAKIAEGIDPAPPVPFLPFCVDRLDHLNVLTWFLAAFTCVLAVRHALLKRGKRLVMHILVWNGVALGVFGAIEQMCGAPGPLWAAPDTANPTFFFSTFGYPNMAGDYFTTLFGISLGLWRWQVEEIREVEKRERDMARPTLANRFWRKHYHLIASFVLFFAAMNTLSRAAIILAAAIALAMYIHTTVCFLARMKRAKRVKAVALSALVAMGIALMVVKFMPGDIRREVDTLDSKEMLDRVSGKSEHNTEYAMEILKDHLFFGCGGWGYRHFSPSKMDKTDKSYLQYEWGRVGRANVHNDCLQFLVEHGVVGFSCLVAVVLFLLAPIGKVWRALMNSVGFIKTKEQPPRPHTIFVIPAPVFCILLTATATVIHSCGDCPLRSPAVLVLFFVSLAAIEGFLPKVVDTVETDSERKEGHHHAARQ